jgi:hypothetical protein
VFLFQKALGSSLGMTCRPIEKRTLLGVNLSAHIQQ